MLSDKELDRIASRARDRSNWDMPIVDADELTQLIAQAREANSLVVEVMNEVHRCDGLAAENERLKQILGGIVAAWKDNEGSGFSGAARRFANFCERLSEAESALKLPK